MVQLGVVTPMWIHTQSVLLVAGHLRGAASGVKPCFLVLYHEDDDTQLTALLY